MDGGSDPADALRIDPGVPGIAPLKYDLQAPEHHGRTPGLGHPVVFYLGFQAQVSFNPGDRINDNPLRLRRGLRAAAAEIPRILWL